MKIVSFFISIVCIFLVVLPVQARRSPGQDWQRVETEHFIIVYPKANAVAAGRIAEISEHYYPEVKTIFGYAPPGKTPIVLNDRMDFSNGYAQSIFRKMEFYLTTPEAKTFGPDDPTWLASLFIHEYAHLCQGMRDDGFTAVLTTLFGEVNGVNYVAPRWWVEGLAVYAETQLERGGRGTNVYQNMVMAANLLSDEPWSLAQVGVYPTVALPADRVYIPGFDMIAKLQSLYKKDDLMEGLASQQSAWPFFGLGFVWQRKTGYNPKQIWEFVKKENQHKYTARYGTDRLAMPDAYEVIGTETGVFQQPRWTRRGTLLVFQDDQKKTDAVVEIDPRTNQVLRQRMTAGLRKGRYGYDVQKDDVVMARFQPDLLYQDAYLADLYKSDTDGKEVRLTYNQRCWSPAVAPDSTIACIVNGDEVNHLALLDKTTGIAHKINGPKGASYGSPSWSPQGYRLAVSVRINGVQDICLIDPQSNTGQAICGWDSAADWDPIWSPDNQYVLFVSDRSGTHQIYAYHLEDKKLYKITDAYLGAFDPSVSWDMNLIAFAEYRPGNTQRIMLAPFRPETWQEVALPEVQKRPNHDPVFDAIPVEGTPYRAWPHLVPSLWLPMVGMDQDGYAWGIISAKRDLLENHEWQAQLLYQPTNQKIYADLLYTYAGLPFIVTVKLHQMPNVRYGIPGDDDDTTAYWAVQQGMQCSATMRFLFSQTDVAATQLQVLASYDARHFEDVDVKAYPDQDYTGISGSLLFQHIRQRQRDLFPTAGVTLFAGMKTALSQNSYDGQLTSAALNGYIPSPVEHHAFGLGVRAVSQAGIFPETYTASAPLGYTGGQFNQGNNFTWSANYRFPVLYIDRGPGLIPVFFHDLWAEIFFEQGVGWDGAFTRENWETHAVISTGLKIHLDTELFWYVPAKLSQGLFYRVEDGSYQTMLEFNLGF